MGTTSRDLHELSKAELESYISNLRQRHDKFIADAMAYEVNPEIFAASLRIVEEELCWAEHELTARIESKKYKNLILLEEEGAFNTCAS